MTSRTDLEGLRAPTGETAEQYHSDELAERASLSRSIAHVLLTESPRHAWAKHPRLNPAFEPDHGDGKFDIGTAAHGLILEGMDRAVSVAAADWRTNAAKAERDAAREAGMVPLLAHHYEQTLAMVQAFWMQIHAHRADPPLLQQGAPEQTIRWRDTGVECRARLDYLRSDLTAIDDLKTTSRSADPLVFARNLASHGNDMQAAFYRRGVQRAFDVERAPAFRWIVVETTPPYALSVIEPSADVLAVADDKIDTALRLWARLLELDGEWPGYPLDVVRAELPPWEETRWLERRETL